jgi:hypothetical protein
MKAKLTVRRLNQLPFTLREQGNAIINICPI